MKSSQGNDVHLVSWSGGLDSTWLVWHLCRQGFTVCADHYHQVRLSGRRRMFAHVQYCAVSKIAPELELCGLAVRRVEPEEKDSRHDIVWCAEIAIDDAIHGLHTWPAYFYLAVRRDEQSKSQILRQAAARDLWTSFAPSWTNIVVPSIELTRAQMWQELPEEIRKLTWSCRNPKLQNRKFVACGVCRPCKELTHAGVPLQRELCER